MVNKYLPAKACAHVGARSVRTVLQQNSHGLLARSHRVLYGTGVCVCVCMHAVYGSHSCERGSRETGTAPALVTCFLLHIN